ncbi:MAG: recombinase family protein [Oscillospiraceae bacterium]|nr:recombinase family protein [Oscillospiraceae bacterium]
MGYPSVTLNIFNDWFARDTSKKIRAIFKAKGQSGKPLSYLIYGYKPSETDKNLWAIDDEAAEVVRKIFHLCIDGYGPAQIARILTKEGIPTPTAYALSQGRDNGHKNANLNRWGTETISGILEKPEYAGHTVNFRTHVKSYKNKKRVDNPQEDWLIFENTHEPIVTQQEFDLVQELRKNKRRPTKHEEVNPFSGICYCADCGKKLYLCRATTMTADQEHLKCGTYAKDKNGCTIHFIRTIVLKEIILGELNKMISFVKENEDEFVQAAMDNSIQKQSSELAKSRNKLKEAEKRIAELDRLFTRLYEDNVSGKISDERFSMMSTGYEDEQKKLRATVAELTAYLDTAEQKSADVTAFIKVVQKYEHITELTPEIMHELIEKIIVHAPDKSSGHRTQEIEIHYRFNVAVTTAVADSMKYDKKRKAA